MVKKLVMYVASSTTIQAVRDILNSNRFYLQALQAGIANLTALAEKIKPQVEKKMGGQVSTNTIVASLKRVGDRLVKHAEPIYEVEETPKNLKMSLTDSIIDVVLDENDLDGLSELYDKLLASTDIPFSLFQTTKNCRLYTDNLQLFGGLEQKFSVQFKAPEKKFTRVAIDISADQEENKLNKLLTEISNILYDADVNIHSAFFTPSEIVLIAGDRDAIRLYDRLHNELLKKTNV
jgi:hypothetical protein